MLNDRPQNDENGNQEDDNENNEEHRDENKEGMMIIMMFEWSGMNFYNVFR